MSSKKKSLSHIIDKKAIEIVTKLLPDFWTIREYRPDYGIDLAIELFDRVKEKDSSVYETLGEHFFVQVKGKENVKIEQYEIKERYNVEKKPLKETKSFKIIDVIKFSLETSELYTIQRMSNVIPVFLFIVDINNEDIYFINLNDYIDKVLIPKDSDYTSNKSKTIYVPVANKITNHPDSHFPLLFYSKRPKFYSFFNKVSYQYNELHYLNEDELVERLQYFSRVLLNLDVWDYSWMWPLFDRYKKSLFNFMEDKNPKLFDFKVALNDTEEEWDTNYSFGKTYTQKQAQYFIELRVLWKQMSNLYNVYEEINRELLLPTMIGETYREE